MHPSTEVRPYCSEEIMTNKGRGVCPDTSVLRSNSSVREGSGLSKSHISTKPFKKGRFKEIAKEFAAKPIYGNGTHWIKLYKGGRDGRN